MTSRGFLYFKSLDPKLFPPGVLAVTDGISKIYCRNTLNDIEMRCILVHEELHILAGHQGEQPEDIELKIREKTAKELIQVSYNFDDFGNSLSLETILHYIMSAYSPEDIANQLYVTTEVLKDFIELVLFPTENILDPILLHWVSGWCNKIKKSKCSEKYDLQKWYDFCSNI